jgi:hypothetical protein
MSLFLALCLSLAGSLVSSSCNECAHSRIPLDIILYEFAVEVPVETVVYKDRIREGPVTYGEKREVRTCRKHTCSCESACVCVCARACVCVIAHLCVYTYMLVSTI